MIGLVPAVGDKHRLPPVRAQQGQELRLQLVAQMAVQRGERLVQQQQARFIDQHARERRALCLPAGKLGRTVLFQPLELQHCNHFAQALPAHGLVLFAVQAAQDVFLHRHVREQGVVLEQIAHPALLRGQVDAARGIEQRFAVQHDAALVRRLHACDTFERHALAAAGRAQQAGDRVVGLKAGVQHKIAQPLADLHEQAHMPRTPLRCLRSSRLTVSSTAAEIARLTSTQ